MAKLLACMIVFAAACSGDAPPPAIDAPGPAPKAFGATCTTVVDTGSTECDSGVCTNTFDMLGHSVCSQKCTPGDGSTCPVGADGTMKCNTKGYCKP